MLHKFLDEGDWFPPKRFGYGSGLPFAWQGWVLLAAHLLIVIGVAVWASREETVASAVIAGGTILVATAVFLIIARKRTRGGWRWRSGEDT